MDLKAIQKMNQPVDFRSGTEVVLAMTEELGEIAQEVALLERVGTKKNWEKQPSKERLGEELSHLLNLLTALANTHQINLSELYERKQGLIETGEIEND